MLGSNPSADSEALTDRGDATRHPFFRLSPLIGRGSKAVNPGGAGAKPLPEMLQHFLSFP